MPLSRTYSVTRSGDPSEPVEGEPVPHAVGELARLPMTTSGRGFLLYFRSDAVVAHIQRHQVRGSLRTGRGGASSPCRWRIGTTADDDFGPGVLVVFQIGCRCRAHTASPGPGIPPNRSRGSQFPMPLANWHDCR